MRVPGLLLVLWFLACGHPEHPRSDRVAIQIDPDEATAMLAMARAPSDAAWARVVATAGFRRLRARELAMQRPFDEATLRSFAQSPELASRATALADAVVKWSSVDLDAIARRVLAYLPREARLTATVYPVIKPASNSFVNKDEHGAAIFVFVDPVQTAAQFDNTIAHELHHIGFASLPDEPCAASPGVRMSSSFFATSSRAGSTTTPLARARWSSSASRGPGTRSAGPWLSPSSGASVAPG